MRLFFIIFILSFSTSISSYAQDITKSQSDSIYKANKVKSRIEQTNGSYISRIITNYDKNGKETELIELDTAGKIYDKKVFEYDREMKCIQTISYPYKYEDSITNEKLDIPYVDSNYVFAIMFSYYKDNMLKSKIERKLNGELYSRVIYSYNPKIETEQFIQSNKVELESKTFFLKNGLREKLFRQTGNKTEKWDFTYRYKYDSIGRVIETIYDIKYSATSKKYYHKINYPIRETYEYFQNGLLKRYTDYYDSKMSWVHDLTYEYW